MINIPKHINTIKNVGYKNKRNNNNNYRENTVKIARFANIFSPNSLYLQHMRIRKDKTSYVESGLYYAGIDLGDLSRIDRNYNGTKIFTNIVIESNYDIILGITYDVKEFNMNKNISYSEDVKKIINDESIKNMGSLSNESNSIKYPEDIIIFHPLKIGKNIKIDILMDNIPGSGIDIMRLPIYISPEYEKTPDIIPYIKINGSFLIYDHNLTKKFNNTYLKLNPFDPDSTYLKFSDNKRGSYYSLLTKNELLLVSDKNHISDSIKKIDQRDNSIMNVSDKNNAVSQKEIDDIFESLVSDSNKKINMRDMIDMYISSDMGQSGLDFPKLLNGHQ
jgi:hypothetical protein